MTDEVRQEDREAAADINPRYYNECAARAANRLETERIRRGELDDHPAVQAFALHASRLRTRIAELERILGVFLGRDDRFQIMVGGNPAAVEEMMAEACATLSGEKKHG